MKLQQLIYKVEELKALLSLYEQTQQGLAQASMLQTSLEPDTDADTLLKVEQTVNSLQTRCDTVQRLLLERTCTADEDAAVDVVQSHIMRLQQYQQLRAEQLQLRIQLDLELAMGVVPAETRKAAEDSLHGLQQRMETLVSQGHAAFPGQRILTLT